MRVHRAFEELAAVPGPVVLAIGVFDGVHLGHQAVIRAAQERALEIGGSAAVLTFDPHPAKILRPAHAPRLLTSTAHKLRLLEGLGVEEVFLVPFDLEFAATPPEEFIRKLVISCRPLAQITIGHGWAFGRNRSGNVELLRQLGQEQGFDLMELQPVLMGGSMVSSTRIREAIERGDFPEAKSCLGRDYTILGTVQPGAGLGRQLGFPTANLAAHNEQFPPNGVYAVSVEVTGECLAGVANIGVRPTVESAGERLLEVHLLEGGRNLYGQDVEVKFVEKLRGEKKFPGIEALKEQIARDAEKAREICVSL